MQDQVQQYLYDITNTNDVLDLLNLKSEISREELEEDVSTDLIKSIDSKINSLNNNGREDYTKFKHFDDFDLSVRSWNEENPSNLIYPQWLLNIGIPEYYPLPNPEIQNKLFAICCFINSSAIPGRSNKARKEAELPLLYFTGGSGSGKSEGCSIISLHHYPQNTLITSADSTGTSLRNDLHSICSGVDAVMTDPSRVTLKPAFIEINNWEPKFIDRWKEMKTLILSVLRSQSVSKTGDIDIAGGNKVYYTFALKAFTSVVHPKVLSTSLSELYRRLFFIFTEKSSNFRSISRLSFTDIPSYWNKEIWCLENRDRWYKCLKQFLGKDSVDVPIPAKYYPQSVVILATGMFLEFWDNEKEAMKHLCEYWELVEHKEKSHVDDISILTKEFIQQEAFKDFYDVSKRSEELSREELIKLRNDRKNNVPIPETYVPRLISIDELFNYVQENAIVTPKNKVASSVNDYMLYEGWYRQRIYGLWYYSKEILKHE